MKVAFASYDKDDDICGISSWLHRLLPLLQSAGVEVEAHLLSYTGKPAANCDFFRRHNIPFRCAPMGEFTDQSVEGYLKLIEEGQPDIYVANSQVSAFFAAGFARAQGIASIGVLHTDDPFNSTVIEEFCRGAEFRPSAMVGVSSFLGETLHQLKIKDLTVAFIGYGVPIPAEPARLSDTFRLVFVGRLVEPQKRATDVARALCAAARQIPGVEAWMAGDGGSRPNIEKLLAENTDLGGRVRLLGRIENAKIYETLKECHALVLLSDFEGLPIAVLEAMATGVVPICLEMRSGINDVLEHGKNGFIVKNRGDDFLATVKTLRDDPDLWSRVSASARATIVDRFSMEACVRDWLELLRSLEPQTFERRRFVAPSPLTLPDKNPKFGFHDRRDTLGQKVIDLLNPAIRRIPAPVFHRLKKAIGRA